MYDSCVIFSLANFVLKICSELVTYMNSEKKIISGGLRLLKPTGKRGGGDEAPHQRLHLQAPDTFGLNPPSHLVIGYHWLAFLNQVCKRRSPQFTRNFVYKIDHISKTKNHTLSKAYINPFQNIAHFLGQKRI